MKTLKTENDVKALVKDWFKERGGWSYATTQNGLGVHGVPDRVGVIPLTITPEMVGGKIGVFVGIECKRPGRRGEKDRGMSKHQMLVLQAIDAAYGEAIVCDSQEDLDRLTRRVATRSF